MNQKMRSLRAWISVGSARIYRSWENYLGRERSAMQRYGSVLLLDGLLIGLCSTLTPDAHVPVTTMFLVIILFSAIQGGVGPGFLAGILSSAGVDFYFIHPLGEVNLDSWSIYILIAASLFVSILVSLLTSSFRIAFKKAQQARALSEEATRSRDRMIAWVSHDLKQPLSSMALQAEVFRHALELRNFELSSKVLTTLEASLLDMRRLIEDLVDASERDTKEFSVRLEPVLLEEVAERALDRIRSAASRRDVDLSLDTPSGKRLWITADAGRIQQVLGNLLDNAVKFTPPRGTIQMKIEALSEGVARIEVTDTGPGIPASDLQRIFEERWQARETAHLGSGLGLAICQKIVRAHGGRIWAESAQGRGTSFFVELPRAQMSLRRAL